MAQQGKGIRDAETCFWTNKPEKVRKITP